MKKLTNPISAEIKEVMVEKLYYRWDKRTVVTSVMERFQLDLSEESRLLDIASQIEEEVTKMRLRVGKIN
jgi:hypothetical protein